MKKTLFYFLFLTFFISIPAHSAESKIREFHASGEVLTVDPVYSQVTIAHGAIKGLALDSETQFFVASPAILKGIRTGDLVDFDITEDRGDMRIGKIEKTGVAPPKDDSSPLGQAVNDVLQGTGNVVKGVTEPVAPAHEVAKGATSITDATGEALKDSGTEAKSRF